MYKILNHREFDECYLLQFFRQVEYLDLISSEINPCLLLIRAYEKKYKSPVRKAIIYLLLETRRSFLLWNQTCFFYKDINLDNVYRKGKAKDKAILA